MRAFPFAAFCLAATAVAQSYVSPPGFAAAEGTGNNLFPFGIPTVPFRYCQVHDDVPAMVINGLAFRYGSVNTVFPAHAITLDAWLSTAVTSAATMSTTFAANHGNDRVRVITGRTYNLPASDPFALPGPFVIDLTFDVPFAYAGGAPLCWEVQVTAKTQAVNIAYDMVLAVGSSFSSNPQLAVNRVGTGCLASGRSGTNVITAVPGSQVNWAMGSGSLSVSAANLLPSGAVFFTQGFSRTTWNAMALPAVIPGSAGAPSGPCTVYAEVLAATMVVASIVGSASLSATFPASPLLNGLTMYSQVWGLDPAANAMGVTTSNVTMHSVVAPILTMPLGRVFLEGSLGAVGTFGAEGLVTRFH